jgi:hypothetical protein
MVDGEGGEGVTEIERPRGMTVRQLEKAVKGFKKGVDIVDITTASGEVRRAVVFDGLVVKGVPLFRTAELYYKGQNGSWPNSGTFMSHGLVASIQRSVKTP